MIRIGDFPKLSRVSVKTLRFCDEMWLLKPVEVDRFADYRYYEFHQLPTCTVLLVLPTWRSKTWAFPWSRLDLPTE